jgi:hypothetical protein
MRDRTDHTDELARYLTRRPRVPAKMTGSTTPGGGSIDTAIWTLPQEIGDVGDVLTVVNDGGDIVPDWVDPGTITAGGRYRALVYELDGAGGFEFLTDLDGHPIYELAELEP